MIFAWRFADRIAALCLCLFALCGQAHAHQLSTARIEIETVASGPVSAQAELDLALRDLALSLPLDADRNEQLTWGELQRARPAFERMATVGMTLRSATGACKWTPRSLAVRRYDDGGYASLRLDALCPDRNGLRLEYGLLFDRDPQHRVLVASRNGRTQSVEILDNDRRELVLSAASGHGFLGFLREGVRHILIGYDHLAFLFSLLLPAVLIRVGGQWRPQTSVRACMLQATGVVTAFTAAHSITLGLAALGWVTPASRWVELAIAVSVLFAAMNNIRAWISTRLWAMGFCFGLIHGFGFAGALGELGLPQQSRLLSLLGFNLGVEIGQLALASAALPLLFLLRTQRWYARNLMPALSLGIAAIASVWIWQRLAV